MNYDPDEWTDQDQQQRDEWNDEISGWDGLH
jgi:hypothetical protein